jgi:hypothetical protein
MSRWRPDPTHVEDQEVIGRRVYADRVFRKNPKLRVDHFQDKRLENDLSVDRLGNPNPVNKVKKHLAHLAGAANPTLPFAGWGAIRVADIRRNPAPLEVNATPTEDNEYHADICRARFREQVHAINLAYRLRAIAEEKLGFHEAPSVNPR